MRPSTVEYTIRPQCYYLRAVLVPFVIAGKMKYTRKKAFTKWVNSQLEMVRALCGHQSCSQSAVP